jgi:hypothetical protein
MREASAKRSASTMPTFGPFEGAAGAGRALSDPYGGSTSGATGTEGKVLGKPDVHSGFDGPRVVEINRLVDEANEVGWHLRYGLVFEQ